MSIRFLARDLYRMVQHVEDLKRKLEKAPLHQQEALEDQIRRARAERDYLRRALDGCKASEK